MANQTTHEDIRDSVRKRYARAAGEQESADGASCCDSSCADVDATSLGYSAEDIAAAPEGAEMGLGCGNPIALASLQPGEVVVDLGSGGGFDCFLASNRVGPTGRVIGVDMTPEMVSKARRTADGKGFENVEFRLGEIEHLPVADDSADVIMSNCVVNLSPDKPEVLRESFRVLRSGGRLAISDLLAVGPMPDEVRADLDRYAECVSGAVSAEELEGWLDDAGFVNVTVAPTDATVDEGPWVAPFVIEARKP